MSETLTRNARQGGAYPVKIELVDENGDAADDANVSAVTVSLQNRDGDFINSVDRTAISAVATQTHTFSAADMLIEDETKKMELRIMTIEYKISSVDYIMQVKFFVENMELIPHA